MQDGVLQASLMLFNVPIEPERALNPPQLCKRTALLQDGSIRQDPRRSRTVRGVTALTRDMDTHTEPINTHLRRLPRVRRATKQAEEEPHRPIQMHLVGPPSTHQWPVRLYARVQLQLGTRSTCHNEAHLPVDSERSLAVEREGLAGTSKADLHTRGTSRPLQPSRSFTYVPRATQL